jgi:hypothetical protein
VVSKEGFVTIKLRTGRELTSEVLRAGQDRGLDRVDRNAEGKP